MTPEVPKNHPRYESLVTREKIIEGMHQKIVAEAGLIAHGRGEAFDYILGENTPDFALKQEKLAVITLLKAEEPVISINGNVAVLCPNEIVELSRILEAPLEINLFYRRLEREEAIKNLLEKAGAQNIYGVDQSKQETIPEISHQRRIVDSRGIARSDCVFVPLEDGDRTMALRKLGKDVVTVDLNPLSRTSLTATVSITNNVSRAVKEMVSFAKDYKNMNSLALEDEKKRFDNKALLQEALKFMSSRLEELASDRKLFEV
ncbi:MAG: phosphopantothenate/pantothenate synthetase [Candidatus Heimdallarchaeota archaeon]|nr:MAG: phosphopantothenate/pantothenate synthetase [Candidatus Heimdallarchaeota archaeon]